VTGLQDQLCNIAKGLASSEEHIILKMSKTNIAWRLQPCQGRPLSIHRT
jgi:hypothetical protein